MMIPNIALDTYVLSQNNSTLCLFCLFAYFVLFLITIVVICIKNDLKYLKIILFLNASVQLVT